MLIRVSTCGVPHSFIFVPLKVVYDHKLYFFLSQAGNVVTGEMVEELILAGADIIKVGVGPGKTGSTAEGECGKEGSVWLAGTGDGQEGAHEWPIHKFKARFFWNYH